MLSDDIQDALRSFAEIAGTPSPDLSDPAVAEFADQFALDVASLDDEQRHAFFAAAGADAFTVTQQIYVHDMAPRLHRMLATLHLGLPEITDVTHSAELWGRLEAFMSTVARLHHLDPALTEIVRLRGARLHDCAICKSRRNLDAIAAGATDSDFEAIDGWRTSALPERTKAALGLVDAMVLSDEVDVAATRRFLSDDQIVEVLLDVVRNAANKIAVALGADAANVTEGVEFFTTDADGNVEVAAVN